MNVNVELVHLDSPSRSVIMVSCLFLSFCRLLDFSSSSARFEVNSEIRSSISFFSCTSRLRVRTTASVSHTASRQRRLLLTDLGQLVVLVVQHHHVLLGLLEFGLHRDLLQLQLLPRRLLLVQLLLQILWDRYCSLNRSQRCTRAV